MKTPSIPTVLMVRTIPLLLALILLGIGARAAHAYPQWQFVSGATRCNQCHYGPAGGGLITGYGRDAAGEELSTFEGSGEVLHGAVELPSWLSLGFDGRLAVLSHDDGSPEGARRAVFPMQADLHVRLALGAQFSAAATVGYRAQVRQGNDAQLGEDNFAPRARARLISREHYLMWRPQAKGPYVRVGRFHAPFGLRLAEHTAYVRRDLGFNLLHETYGASAGYVTDEWELHGTAFAPDFTEYMTRDRGAVVLYERRIGDVTALGFQGRLAMGQELRRYTGGAFWKRWAEGWKTLFQTEVNVTMNQAGGVSVPELTLFAGPTVFPFKGLWVMPFYELRQSDVNSAITATHAYGGQINWFPYPHVELVLLGRIQRPSGQKAAQTGFFFLHYYL
jgi:hypothetical protein